MVKHHIHTTSVRLEEKKKPRYYKLLSRLDLISRSIFVISHHSSGARSDEAVCCRLMETGVILQLNDLSWLGADFISKVLFFFSFPEVALG